MKPDAADIRVLVPLAEGAEELEAVTIIDLLRRAGFTVVVAGLEPGPVRCARGTVIVPDRTLDAIQGGQFQLTLNVERRGGAALGALRKSRRGHGIGNGLLAGEAQVTPAIIPQAAAGGGEEDAASGLGGGDGAAGGGNTAAND